MREGHLAEQPSARIELSEALRYVWRIALMLRPHWVAVLRGLALGVAPLFLSLSLPMLAKQFYDVVYPTRSVGLLQALVLAVVVLTVAQAVVGAVRSYFGTVVGTTISAELELHFFNHLQQLPLSFFERRRTGELLSRSQDLQKSARFVIGAVQNLLTNGFFLLLVPPLLLVLEWRLALLATLTVPITSACSLLIGRIIRNLSRTQLEASAEAGAFQFEVLSNIRTLKSLGGEPWARAGMSQRVAKARGAQLRVTLASALLGVLNGVVRAGGAALSSYVAWMLIIRGEISIGDLIAFNAYIGYLTGPITSLGGFFPQLQQATVSLSRFFEYYDAPVERASGASDVSGSLREPREAVSLSLKNVTFRYQDGKPILQDLCLEVGAGAVVALVGKSGAGKSSLLRLLPRLYLPERGEVFVGDRLADSYSIAELRSTVALVSPDAGLLHGTLWDNLTIGVHSPRPEVVARSLKLSQLDELVHTLPLGLNTPVAEFGASLSAGQRQRVAIARALVREPRVLLLDEATSSLDPSTEEAVLAGLIAERSGVTILMATHRISAAAMAERVYVLDGGKLLGGKPHHELMSESDAYRGQWDAYRP